MSKYTIKSGDTLYKVARDNGLTLQNLLDANPSIRNLNHIQIGDIINIPSTAGVDDGGTTIDPDDADVMARTIMGEARGESDQGKVAVGWVILNRARSGKWFGGGGDIFSVCRKPYQFSCWNPGDPNFPIITNARVGDSDFDACLVAAKQVLSGSVADPTGGATHYYAEYIAAPSWTQHPAKFTVQIGVHKFYENVS
jgi:N-acetylmuramoyl-L-alanine amidase